MLIGITSYGTSSAPVPDTLLGSPPIIVWRAGPAAAVAKVLVNGGVAVRPILGFETGQILRGMHVSTEGVATARVRQR